MQEIKKHSIPYLTRYILDLDYDPIPAVDNLHNFLIVLNSCQSKLEATWLLGFIAAYEFYYNLCHNCRIDFVKPFLVQTETSNGWDYLPGIIIPDAHSPFIIGPSSLAIVTQYPFNQGKYHHDFAILTSEDNHADEFSDWHMKLAIEVDGLATHRHRRDVDIYRDNFVNYPVLRFYEETVDLFLCFHELVEFELTPDTDWETKIFGEPQTECRLERSTFAMLNMG